MGFKCKLLFSALVLCLSIIAYKSFNDNKTVLSKRAAVMMIFTRMDAFLKSIGFPGFLKRLDNLLASIQFWLVDSTGLNISVKEFDGVEVMIFDPIKHEDNRPAIVHYHGGGWIFHSPKYFSTFLAEVARQLNMLIVAVNYRKAPENPFPVGVNDAIKATRYFMSRAEQFGVDPKRIALMGESAGGNFVIAVGHHLAALHRSDVSIRLPKILISKVPVVQMANMDMPSIRSSKLREIFAALICQYAFGELPSDDFADCASLVATNSHLDQATVERVKSTMDWSKYLSGREYDNADKSIFLPSTNKFSEKFATLIADPLFSPLTALNDTELDSLPRVYLMVASKDFLKDEGKIFAARLKERNRLEKLIEFDQEHGEYLFSDVKSSSFQEVIDFLYGIIRGNEFF